MSLRELVGIALRLRIALLRGSFRTRGGTARLIALVVGSIAALFWGGLILLGMVAARASGSGTQDAALLLFNALLVAWVVLPVLTFVSDDLLDPAKLALLPLTGAQRVIVSGVGSLIGVGAAFTLLVSLSLLTVVDGPGALVVAVVAVVLQLALCVTLSRTCVALLSGALRSRRGRDLGVLLVVLLGLGFQLVNAGVQVFLNDARAAGDVDLHSFASPVRWTPAGWLAAAPTASPAVAVGSLVATAALVAGLVVVWGRTVARAAERVDLTTQARRSARRARGLMPRLLPLPAGRTGAVAAKELRYVTRDPRRLATLAYAGLLPVVVALPFVVSNGSGVSPHLVYLIIGIGLLGGTTAGNRFGMDGSAVYLLITTWTDRRDPRRDLAGGDLAAALIAVPLVVLAGLVLAALGDGWWYLPSALGMALALLAIGLGGAAVQAVIAAWPMPQNATAFSGGGGSGAGFQAFGTSMLLLAGELAALAPLLGLLIPALVMHSTAWSLVLLVVGPAYGAAVGEGLRRVAAARWQASAPEVLLTVSAAR
ncbi:hypothetical protein ACIB24_06675 [Spongisporangium articulatum]|uniref:ABC-2 type transport system permease protein n=1 Tax=Spongisporangium articulatum TaxID=3362603 RepID=A0ABW8AK60_9ACTN